MRIVIDMQGAQTESRFRGIGRYTMAFAQAVVRNRGEHQIFLALSGLFPDTIEPIRATFNDLLPQENIRVWHAPGPVKECEAGNDTRRQVAEIMREAFLTSLQPDVIHVTSLFEGFVDDAVTSIGRFDQDTAVSVSLYDLIPLINPAQYLTLNPTYAAYYQRKIGSLNKAKCCLAISEFSRLEGIYHLSQDDDQIINISASVDEHFKSLIVDPDETAEFLIHLNIKRPFVLYTGGEDERKNLTRLIQAYALLPVNLRKDHHLVFAGKIPPTYINQFKQTASNEGLAEDELIFTGYLLEEDLVKMYNLCKLFVCPSWHEGFGLTALEAMACGAAVIGANTTSLPEVIGLGNALFDPFDVNAISVKLLQALQDQAFRRQLQEHAKRQSTKFSWDLTAIRAISAWKSRSVKQFGRETLLPSGYKPRLAFVSPMPPERTGIADYSAELLPALSKYYDIDLVVHQDHVDANQVSGYATVRDVAWLRAHASEVDRVIYQMGNSPFHQHMLALIKDIPGTVVLHDFFLSGLMSWLEVQGVEERVWSKALYETHGYSSVQLRYQNIEAAKQQFPVNGHVLRYALGVIVHSTFSKQLARQWHGEQYAEDWRVIPLLRATHIVGDRQAARHQLGFSPQDILVCSFGFLDPTKLNHRLLEAWFGSSLSNDTNCHLVFVGQNHDGDYGDELMETINRSECGCRIKITGFASPDLFNQYLAAADIAVQLRAQTRGETSAAVLDCMNHGISVVVNAHGTMAELVPSAVWVLQDEFDDNALMEALEELWRSPERRRSLGEQARKLILDLHAPDACAKQYAEAIEAFHLRKAHMLQALIPSIAGVMNNNSSDNDLLALASALSRNHPQSGWSKRLYLDISATSRNDLKSGIERVARALTLALLEAPPEGFRIEPVYLSEENGRFVYRHARRYTLGLMGSPTDSFVDDIVVPNAGDVLLGLDLSGDTMIRAGQSGLYKDLRRQGVFVYATVFDLLPVRMPEVFPPEADQTHIRWLETISEFDGAVCISKSVADDLKAWQELQGLKFENRRKFSIDWFHMGADVTNSAPSRGMPSDADKTLKKINSRPSFLMVGTIEPRKGYLQTLQAFDYLWKQGLNINLVIVGREGWKGLPDSKRRDIPQTLEQLRSSPELDQHLFWLEGISDEYLEKVYAASAALIAASYGEGFGLPLIEAAQHKLPIICRDIPVFKEVAGAHAFYFEAGDAIELSASITKWLVLHEKTTHPTSECMHWMTWNESAEKLQHLLISSTLTKKGTNE
jgi:glycosyltransferase involved in cell wall biosynthesis